MAGLQTIAACPWLLQPYSTISVCHKTADPVQKCQACQPFTCTSRARAYFKIPARDRELPQLSAPSPPSAQCWPLRSRLPATLSELQASGLSQQSYCPAPPSSLLHVQSWHQGHWVASFTCILVLEKTPDPQSPRQSLQFTVSWRGLTCTKLSSRCILCSTPERVTWLA